MKTPKQLYRDYIGAEYYTKDKFEEAYQGEYSSLKDYAYELLEELDPEFMEKLRSYYLHFDIDDIAWEQDYVELEGHIFRKDV